MGEPPWILGLIFLIMTLLIAYIIYQMDEDVPEIVRVNEICHYDSAITCDRPPCPREPRDDNMCVCE